MPKRTLAPPSLAVRGLPASLAVRRSSRSAARSRLPAADGLYSGGSSGQLGCTRCHWVGADRMRCSSSMAMTCVPVWTDWRNRPAVGSSNGGRKTSVWAVVCLP